MKVFKNCATLRGKFVDISNNAINVKRVLSVNSVTDYIKRNLLVSKVITVSDDSVSGYKSTPDKLEAKDSMLLGIQPNVYAFTYSFGKKVIPSGYVKNEYAKRLAEHTKEFGEPDKEGKKDILNAVKDSANSKAMIKYTDVTVLLDFSIDDITTIHINQNNGAIINEIVSEIVKMIDNVNVHRFESDDAYMTDLKMVDSLILKDCIDRRTFPVLNVRFSDETKNRVLNFSSKEDVLNFDGDAIEELYGSASYTYNKFKYENNLVGVIAELVQNVIAPYQPVCYKLTSIEKGSGIDSEGDVINEVINELSFEYFLINKFHENTLTFFEE